MLLSGEHNEKNGDSIDRVLQSLTALLVD